MWAERKLEGLAWVQVGLVTAIVGTSVVVAGGMLYAVSTLVDNATIRDIRHGMVLTGVSLWVMGWVLAAGWLMPKSKRQ